MSPIRSSVFGAVVVVLVAGTAAADVDGDPNVKRLGKTVMRWRDDAIQLVIGSRHAHAHLDKKWILLDTYLSATGSKPVEIWREDVSLVMPDGTRLNLPSQRRMAKGIPDLRRMLHEADIASDPLRGYFPSAVREERLGFFAIPGEDIVFDKVGVDHLTVAWGDLFFESPGARWDPGIYTFVIENRDVHVRLPLTLGVEGSLERVK